MPITFYTDGGERKDPTGKPHGGWGVYVRAEEYSVTFGGTVTDLSEPVTNNKAELTAFIKSLKAARFLKDKKPIIYLDSQYVKKPVETKGLQRWKQRQWIKSDGQPVKNKPYWEEIIVSLNGLTPELHWVKGHSGDVGNDAADEGATAGVDYSIAGTVDKVFVKVNSGKDKVPLALYQLFGAEVPDRDPEVKVKKAKVEPPHSMLMCSRIIATSDRNYQTYDEFKVYYQATYNDKDDIKARNFGKPDANCAMAISYLKTEEVVISELLTKQRAYLPSGMIKPIIIGWDKVKTSTSWPDYVSGINVEALVFGKHFDGNLGDKLILQYLDRPRLAMDGIEALNLMDALFRTFHKKQFTGEVIDLTETLFTATVNNKGVTKYVANKDVADTEPVMVKVKHACNKDARVIPRLHMPDRNGLNRVAKAAKEEVKAYMLVTDITKFSYRFYIILEIDGEFTIYGNPYSNIIFGQVKETKK